MIDPKLPHRSVLKPTPILVLQIIPVMDIGTTTSMTLRSLTEFFSQALLSSLTQFWSQFLKPLVAPALSSFIPPFPLYSETSGLCTLPNDQTSWVGCDSDNGDLVSSRTVIPEYSISKRCFLLDIGFQNFLSVWSL